MSLYVKIALNVKKCWWTCKEYEHAVIMQHHEAHASTLKCMTRSEIFLSFLMYACVYICQVLLHVNALWWMLAESD